MMKKTILFALGLVMSMTTLAQDTVETTISGDVVSHYVWRGQDLGNVALQPTLGVSYKGLSLSGWGTTGLSTPEDVKELDLTLSYTIGGLTVAVTDYWNNDPEGNDPTARYFKYDAHHTNHTLEASIGYNFGFASLQWSTNFAGSDYQEEDGKRAYSSYVEVAVPFKLSTIDWTATAGVVPYASDYYKTNGFAVTNLSLRATKAVKVTDSFSIPLFGEVIANPCSQKAYLVFGFTLKI